MQREGWEGATVVCVASGPSLTAADCEIVRQAHAAARCRVIVVNSSFVSVPFADVLYAGDFAWWVHYERQLKAKKWTAFHGERWSCSQSAASRYKLNFIAGYQGPGISRNKGRIHLGGNSGYAAVSLAVEFGAARIVLLGYDMQRTGNRSHHHGDHPAPLGNGNAFPSWVRRFGVAAKDLEKLGISCVNASRATALTCFKRQTIEEALCTTGTDGGCRESCSASVASTADRCSFSTT